MMNNKLIIKQPVTITTILLTVLLFWYTFFFSLKFIASKINSHYLFIICTLIILLIELTTNLSQYLKTSRSSFAWYLFILYSVINAFIFPYTTEALKWIVMLVTIYLVRAILMRNPNIASPLVKVFWIASSIHVFFILLQSIFPDIEQSINNILISTDLTAIEMIQEGGSLKGINTQSATAGLIATLFVGFVASGLTISNKIRIKQVVLLIIGIIAIILTLKRSFLISSVVGLYFIALLSNWDRRTSSFFKMISISLVLVIGFYIAVETVPQLQEMVARTMRVGNALSGREQMFSHMWGNFREHPILGIGNGYAEAVYSYGSHNVYLQLLAESGVVGFALFNLIFIGQFIRNIKITIPFIKSNPMNYSAKKRIYTSLYMQMVFFLYCLSGNPLYDYPFLVLFVVFFIIPELENTPKKKFVLKTGQRKN